MPPVADKVRCYTPTIGPVVEATTAVPGVERGAGGFVVERPVIVAGGGIGGLAVSLGLARKGRRVTVLERAASLGEIGAGIQLGPNAFHAFDALGVGNAAR